MRLVTWNCYRGECRKRAALLDDLNPDLVVLQECGRPDPIPDRQCVWFGNRPLQGVGVVARGDWTLESAPLNEKVLDSVYPVRVRGPIDFNLLVVWAQQQPTYVRAILHGLNHYRSFLTDGPAMAVGDFNSHPRWDFKDREASHTALEGVLSREFGLVSAYHAAAQRDGNFGETPTLYWRWQEEQPFHIDYSFIPRDWASRLGTVSVGDYAKWKELSDHRPLFVEVRE